MIKATSVIACGMCSATCAWGWLLGQCKEGGRGGLTSGVSLIFLGLEYCTHKGGSLLHMVAKQLHPVYTKPAAKNTLSAGTSLAVNLSQRTSLRRSSADRPGQFTQGSIMILAKFSTDCGPRRRNARRTCRGCGKAGSFWTTATQSSLIVSRSVPCLSCHLVFMQ